MPPKLVGVSSVEAAAEGPVSVSLDEGRLMKACRAVLVVMGSAAASGEEDQEGAAIRKVHLTWNCIDSFDAEKFIRTRIIRLHNAPHKGARSCLIAGGQVRRYIKKNKNRPSVDTIISAKALHHKNLDVAAKKVQDVIDEYPLILCDNRCFNEIPTNLKRKVVVKLDCTDMKAFTKRVEWGLKSTSIKTGKGNLSVAIGTNLLTPAELAENVRFTLRFIEDHLPDIWVNLNTVSIQATGTASIQLLNRSDTEFQVADEGRYDIATTDTAPDQPPAHKRPLAEDGGVDIFASRSAKKRRKLK